MMINLALKSTGTTDPNLFVSPTGVRKMRIRDGKVGLEGSEIYLSYLMCVSNACLLLGLNVNHNQTPLLCC